MLRDHNPLYVSMYTYFLLTPNILAGWACFYRRVTETCMAADSRHQYWNSNQNRGTNLPTPVWRCKFAKLNS